MSTLLKLKVREFDEMVASGAFDALEHRHIELIHGELRETSPFGPHHGILVAWLTRWSFTYTKKETWIWVGLSVGIPKFDSVPQPDLAWIRSGITRQQHPQPADVMLLIEVSHSSLSYDLGEKKELYAQAGIQEYWVVDIEAEAVHVFRNPSGNQYAQSVTVGPGETIAPQVEPMAVLDVAKLFRAGSRSE